MADFTAELLVESGSVSEATLAVKGLASEIEAAKVASGGSSFVDYTKGSEKASASIGELGRTVGKASRGISAFNTLSSAAAKLAAGDFTSAMALASGAARGLFAMFTSPAALGLAAIVGIATAIASIEKRWREAKKAVEDFREASRVTREDYARQLNEDLGGAGSRKALEKDLSGKVALALDPARRTDDASEIREGERAARSDLESAHRQLQIENDRRERGGYSRLEMSEEEKAKEDRELERLKKNYDEKKAIYDLHASALDQYERGVAEIDARAEKDRADREASEAKDREARIKRREDLEKDRLEYERKGSSREDQIAGLESERATLSGLPSRSVEQDERLLAIRKEIDSLLEDQRKEIEEIAELEAEYADSQLDAEERISKRLEDLEAITKIEQERSLTVEERERKLELSKDLGSLIASRKEREAGAEEPEDKRAKFGTGERRISSGFVGAEARAKAFAARVASASAFLGTDSEKASSKGSSRISYSNDPASRSAAILEKMLAETKKIAAQTKVKMI